MHTVELLERAIALAIQSGFVVRQDWLGDSTAGACHFNGRNWLFVDLAHSPREQLDVVLGALSQLTQDAQGEVSNELQALLRMHKAA
jgi:hypothetical protein